MMTNTDLYRGAPNDNRSLRRGELARPTRKDSLRLKDYDYSLPGPYFFTVCVFNRKEIFKEQDIRGKVRMTQMIIGQVSLPLRDRIWQRSFYEHIIRDENDFSQKAQYIENHPIKEEGNIYAEWH